MNDGSGPIRIDMHLDICVAGSLVDRLRKAREDRDIVIQLGPAAQCDLVALSYLAGRSSAEARRFSSAVFPRTPPDPPVPGRRAAAHDEMRTSPEEGRRGRASRCERSGDGGPKSTSLVFRRRRHVDAPPP